MNAVHSQIADQIADQIARACSSDRIRAARPSPARRGNVLGARRETA